MMESSRRFCVDNQLSKIVSWFSGEKSSKIEYELLREVVKYQNNTASDCHHATIPISHAFLRAGSGSGAGCVEADGG